MNEPGNQSAQVQMTAEIVSAFVSNNSVPPSDLAPLIQSVFTSIQKIAGGVAITPEAEPQEPAVSIRKSVTPDFIICLEDGKKFKSLKRHLRTSYGLSPDQYRAKWNLPRDYPMVAPDYATARSALAKKAGLGRPRAVATLKAAAVKMAEPAGGKKGRGRPRKTAA